MFSVEVQKPIYSELPEESRELQLLLACRFDNVEKVRELSRIINVNFQLLEHTPWLLAPMPRTPLCEAITSPNDLIVKTLLDNKADPNFVNVYGSAQWTPLSYVQAGKKKHKRIISLLINKGADPFFKPDKQSLFASKFTETIDKSFHFIHEVHRKVFESLNKINNIFFEVINIGKVNFPPEIRSIICTYLLPHEINEKATYGYPYKRGERTPIQHFIENGNTFDTSSKEFEKTLKELIELGSDINFDSEIEVSQNDFSLNRKKISFKEFVMQLPEHPYKKITQRILQMPDSVVDNESSTPFTSVAKVENHKEDDLAIEAMDLD